MTESAPVPDAVLTPVRRRSFSWVLPALAAVAALYLGLTAWGGRGPRLVVHASNGHGIRAGDPLLYRGIAVGDVSEVELAQDLTGVLLAVRLDAAAEALARAGSRFWIARPQVGLAHVGGLETLLGARHLAVLPGPAEADPQREFVALEEPPVLTAYEEGSLEIVLAAARTFGLAPGAPITFRQIEVGRILAIGLSGDATAVEIRAAIRARYVPLVREDTRFWETGGFELSLGLPTGIDVQLDSLRGLLVGGVALATPTRPGRPVRTGHRFALHADPEEEWLAWEPALPLGSVLLPPGTPLPQLVRARLDWEEGLFNRKRARAGWLLPTKAGLIGPANVLVAGEDAEDAALELRGERMPIVGAPDASDGSLALRAIFPAGATAWPAERVRSLTEPEELLVVADPAFAPIALAAVRLLREESAWRVDPAIAFDETWHGAAVLSRTDGLLVGLLLVAEGGGTIARVDALVGE